MLKADQYKGFSAYTLGMDMGMRLWVYGYRYGCMAWMKTSLKSKLAVLLRQ